MGIVSAYQGTGAHVPANEYRGQTTPVVQAHGGAGIVQAIDWAGGRTVDDDIESVFEDVVAEESPAKRGPGRPAKVQV